MRKIHPILLTRTPPPEKPRQVVALSRDQLRDWAWRQGVERELAAGSHRMLLWLVEQVELADLTLHISNSDIARSLGVHWSRVTHLRRRLVTAKLLRVDAAVAVGLGRQLEWVLLARS